MNRWKKLSHTIYECTYHVVWIPKYRYRVMTGDVRYYIRDSIRKLSSWKKLPIAAGNVCSDHMTMRMALLCALIYSFGHFPVLGSVSIIAGGYCNLGASFDTPIQMDGNSLATAVPIDAASLGNPMCSRVLVRHVSLHSSVGRRTLGASWPVHDFR